jgi:hypothetical protein
MPERSNHRGLGSFLVQNEINNGVLNCILMPTVEGKRSPL